MDLTKSVAVVAHDDLENKYCGRRLVSPRW